MPFKQLRDNVGFCDEQFNLAENSIQDGKLT